MPKIFNRREFKRLRRRLRNEGTPAEAVLWNYLKGRRFLGYKFRRQQSIGRYIVDFYCPTLKLVVEVDGDTHYEADYAEKDKRRDEWLRHLGLRVMRIRNDEVRGDPLGVLEQLKAEILSHHPYPSSERRG